MSINCLVIEDEPLARDVMIRFIEHHPALDLVTCCPNTADALPHVEKGVDLIFLDINLPDMSGINFYKSLVERPPVIFTTAYPDYAVEGFELDAVDYLLKPFTFERFNKAIDKFLSQKDANSDHLIVKTNKKIYRIATSDIIYIESIGDYVKIYLADQTLISSLKLKELIHQLPDKMFFRIHKSYIVNVTQINFMEGNQVNILDQMIPIGQSYRQNFQELFRSS
ncbi:MAG: response regulator transcription factor [Cyclobacteriaceae bacterium]